MPLTDAQLLARRCKALPASGPHATRAPAQAEVLTPAASACALLDHNHHEATNA